MTEENHEKTPVRLVGTGIRTRVLPNASLVRYHGATSLGEIQFSYKEISLKLNFNIVRCVRSFDLFVERNWHRTKITDILFTF